MPQYKVVISKSVQKYLDKLIDSLANKLENAMLKLEDNPRPYGSEKMSGKETYKLRVGDYRIIYAIEDKILLVTVVHTGHRREVYKPK